MGHPTVFQDAEALSRAAASFFVRASHRALNRSGRFSVALSGGSTPGRMFELLASDEFWRAIPWDRTHLFWGDDRAVGPDHEHSNYRMAHDRLIRTVPIPGGNIHRIKGEMGAQAAADDYGRDLFNHFGGGNVPAFDLALQGMGGDGHTASLFPGTDALNAEDFVVPVLNPPADPKLDRVTLTFPAFAAARNALFLVTGADKREVLARVLNGDEQYPAARFQARNVLWYVDEKAAGE